jgi:hypothetical protein
MRKKVKILLKIQICINLADFSIFYMQSVKKGFFNKSSAFLNKNHVKNQKVTGYQ